MDTSAAAGKPKILMVDDEPDFVTLVGRWLEAEYDFSAQRDGEDLLESAARLKPDAVILDMVLPGEDGLELCRRMRADPRFERLPVLFLTGSRGVEESLRTMRAGAASFLAKPAGRKELLAALGKLLPARRQRRAGAPTAKRRSTELTARPSRVVPRAATWCSPGEPPRQSSHQKPQACRQDCQGPRSMETSASISGSEAEARTA